jgi:thiol-disulfide isomerase/thioredoxin
MNASTPAKSEIDKVKLTNLSNSPIDLGQYDGKTIFINFWATWCKPCLEEMPSIQKAQGILKDENIVFLFASDETAEQIEKFKSGHDYNFNYVRVENPEELNIMALPTTFIFNPDGKLAFSEMGYRKWDDKSNIDLIINIAKSK